MRPLSFFSLACTLPLLLTACAGQPRERSVDPAPIRSVAILPFSADHDNIGLGEGVAREIANRIASSTDLRIVTPSRVPDGEASPGTFQVDAVVDGSIVMRGDEIIIDVQIIGRPGVDSTTAHFELPRHEGYRSVDLVAERTSRLASSGELTAGRPLASGAAWLFAVRGVGLLLIDRPIEAEAILREAVIADPKSSAVRAYLARAVLAQSSAMGDRCEEARTIALRSLEMQPDRPVAIAVAGSVQSRHDWAWEAAGEALRTAVSSDPWDSATRLHYGVHLLSRRSEDEAVEQFRAGKAVDPASPRTRLWLGRALRRTGDLKGAVDELRIAIQLDPASAEHHTELALAAAELRMPALAISEARTAGEQGGSITTLGQVYAILGRVGDAREIAEQLPRLSSHRRFSHSDLAAFALLTGDHDRALIWLQRAVNAREDGLPLLLGDPMLAPLWDAGSLQTISGGVGITATADRR